VDRQLNVATGWVFVSLGLGRRQLATKLATVPIIIAGIAIGVQHGPVGAAVGFSISSVLVRPLAVLWCFSGTPLRVLDLVASVARPTLSGAIAGATAAWMSQAIPTDVASIGTLVLLVGTFVGVYAAAWIGLPGGMRRLRECLSMLDEFRGRRGAAPPPPPSPPPGVGPETL